MYANDTATLNEAIASAKSGNKAAAHVTLAALRSHYPTNPDVLLWLAYTADTSHEARGILDTLAWTDPNNADLKRARMWLAEWEFSATAGQPARHAQPEYAEPTEQSSHVAQPHAISDTQPFVLNLKNQDYLAGRTRKPSLGKNQGGAIFLVLFFSLFGGVGFFVVAASLNESLTKDRMLKTGTAVQATITKLEIDTSGDSTSYDVTYRFIAGNPPRTYNRSQSVNATTYYRYTEGQTTSVHYDPKAPSTSRIDGADDNSFVAYFIGGLFALIGIGGIYAAISYGSKTRALRQRGQLLRGNDHPCHHARRLRR